MNVQQLLEKYPHTTSSTVVVSMQDKPTVLVLCRDNDHLKHMFNLVADSIDVSACVEPDHKVIMWGNKRWKFTHETANFRGYSEQHTVVLDWREVNE